MLMAKIFRLFFPNSFRENYACRSPPVPESEDFMGFYILFNRPGAIWQQAPGSVNFFQYLDHRRWYERFQGSLFNIRRRISVPHNVSRSYIAGDWTLIPASLNSRTTSGFDE